MYTQVEHGQREHFIKLVGILDQLGVPWAKRLASVLRLLIYLLAKFLFYFKYGCSMWGNQTGRITLLEER